MVDGTHSKGGTCMHAKIIRSRNSDCQGGAAPTPEHPAHPAAERLSVPLRVLLRVAKAAAAEKGDEARASGIWKKEYRLECPSNLLHLPHFVCPIGEALSGLHTSAFSICAGGTGPWAFAAAALSLHAQRPMKANRTFTTTNAPWLSRAPTNSGQLVQLGEDSDRDPHGPPVGPDSAFLKASVDSISFSTPSLD